MYVNINGYTQVFLQFSTCILISWYRKKMYFPETSSVILSICIRRKKWFSLTCLHYVHVLIIAINILSSWGAYWVCHIIVFALLACWLVTSETGRSRVRMMFAKSHVSCQCLVVPESPCRSCVRQTSWVIQAPFTTIQMNTIPMGFGQDDCIPCNIYGVGAWCQ